MKFLAAFFLFLTLANASQAACSCDPDASFTLKSEFSGPASATTNPDLNLGNSASSFVTAAYEQIFGVAPPAATLTAQVNNLTTLPYWRRADVLHSFINAHGSPGSYTVNFSTDPWTSQPLLSSAPCKNIKRDVGAVLMFFFSCPAGTNCGMNWADNHTHGMDVTDPLYAFGASPDGYYSPSSNAGFFYRELLDARYAGLQFLLPNVYGPDLSDGSLANLVSALNAVNALSLSQSVQVGMFDDTWGWGNYGFAPWNTVPDMANPANAAAAASLIFNNKWAPYFDAVPSAYWYRVGGRPLIYFYNAGTISPRTNAADVMNKLRNLFFTRYGVYPWLAVDKGFYDDPAMSGVADAQFTWLTVHNGLTQNKSRWTGTGGVVLDHAMVRWDPLMRDSLYLSNQGISVTAKPGDNLIKDGSYLQALLQDSTDADVLVLATWNDLGEGTGINRAYDYYAGGAWLSPSYFMDKIRRSQEQSLCPAVPSTAYGGTPWPIPGVIQAEDFDVGGELGAYHDLDAANQGTSSYRSAEGVDLDSCTDAGGGGNLSYSGKSEWLLYSVNVASTGNYDVAARVAAPAGGAQFHLEMDGVSITAYTVANTGGWQSWASLTNTTVPLTAGLHTLKLYFDLNNVTGRSANLNYLQFIDQATPTPTVSPTATPTATPTASPSLSPTPSASPTITESFSQSPTPPGTYTDTPTLTESPTLSETFTHSPSATATETPTDSPSAAPSASPSLTATQSVTRTLSPTPSLTPTRSLTHSVSPTPSGPGNPEILNAMAAPNPSIDVQTAQFFYQLAGRVDGVELRIYAKSGAMVQDWRDGAKSGGWNSTNISVEGLSSGIYYVQVKAHSAAHSGKPFIFKWMLLK